MPRTPTLENPFAPEKHRSADDPAFVGKILGADAEAAMRRTVADKAEGAEHAERKDDLALTDTELAKIAEEKEKRKAFERARRDLLAWAEEIGLKAGQIFFRPDGKVIIKGDVPILPKLFLGFPEGIVEIRGSINCNSSSMTALHGFPNEVHGNVDLRFSKVQSLEGLPRRIRGNLDLLDVPARRMPQEHSMVLGIITVRSRQTDLIADLKRKKYKRINIVA